MPKAGSRLVTLSLLAALSGCLDNSGVSTRSNTSGQIENPSPSVPGSATGVTVSWNANREKGVNSSGGGYRVYYSKTGSIDANTPFVTVANAGGNTPTTTRLSGLASGTYTVGVIAFSAANPTGSSGTQTTVTVP
ncbi:MAG: hypothetical protein JST04_03155 [Bdellovibrionales bacterium]|nr:hypothetical protein [Bdellovibrionales bacterium]